MPDGLPEQNQDHIMSPDCDPNMLVWCSGVQCYFLVVQQVMSSICDFLFCFCPFATPHQENLNFLDFALNALIRNQGQ